MFNQSRNFRLQKVGGIEWLEKNYKLEDVALSLDELVVLDATKGEKNIFEFSKTLEKIVEDVFIPVSAGGGIRSLEDAKILFQSGADKIILNTALVNNKSLVSELVNIYGSQSIIASIDHIEKNVFIKNGTEKISSSLKEHIRYVELLGVGEIYLNSIDMDGTGFGYDIKTIKEIVEITNIPLIISGGAGNAKHLLEGVLINKIDGVSTANLFNFMGDALYNSRNEIISNNGNLAKWW